MYWVSRVNVELHSTKNCSCDGRSCVLRNSVETIDIVPAVATSRGSNNRFTRQLSSGGRLTIPGTSYTLRDTAIPLVRGNKYPPRGEAGSR